MTFTLELVLAIIELGTAAAKALVTAMQTADTDTVKQLSADLAPAHQLAVELLTLEAAQAAKYASVTS